MSIFDPSHIPANIQSHEQLLVWNTAVMENLHGVNTVREQGGLGDTPRARLFFTASNSGPLIIVRAAIQLPFDYAAYNEKIWGPNKIPPWPDKAGESTPTIFTS
jgi:hypothetical protein